MNRPDGVATMCGSCLRRLVYTHDTLKADPQVQVPVETLVRHFADRCTHLK